MSFPKGFHMHSSDTNELELKHRKFLLMEKIRTIQVLVRASDNEKLNLIENKISEIERILNEAFQN